MRPDRLPALATQLERLARRLRTEGDTALQRAHDWTPGPRPGDAHDTPPQPGDPDYREPAPGITPDTAVTTEQLADRAGDRATARIADQLHRILDTLDTTQHDAHARLDDLRPPTSLRPATSADAAAAGYCRSCWRYDHTLTQVARRRDGTKEFTDYCWWCGQFRRDHGIDPPVSLVEKRIRHGKVTSRDIANALG
ncbi:MAG: hypothetical protein U5R31_03105 [Acidimicrobiia bacterium]|nr:hypothetical protein [Acidimicrobiia bacterium]